MIKNGHLLPTDLAAILRGPLDLQLNIAWPFSLCPNADQDQRVQQRIGHGSLIDTAGRSAREEGVEGGQANAIAV